MGRILRRAKKRRQEKRRIREEEQDRLDEEKIRSKFQRKRAKLSKRNAKKLGKIYGDLNPEDVNAMNEIMPYVGGMNEQLTDAGVEVNNPEDPIEVSMAYNKEFLGEDVGEEAAETFENFYSYNEETDDSVKKKGGGILKVAFGAVSGAFNALKNNAKAKQRSGKKLSETDKRVLQLDNEKNKFVNEQKKEAIGKGIKDLALPAFILLLLYVLFKD